MLQPSISLTCYAHIKNTLIRVKNRCFIIPPEVILWFEQQKTQETQHAEYILTAITPRSTLTQSHTWYEEYLISNNCKFFVIENYKVGGA